jgi:hypothetical protein
LDESSSMIQSWPSGKPKYKTADELIVHLMDSIYAVNDQIEFSLRVFGHQHTVPENNCYDTKNEVPFSRDNRTQMAYRLDDIKPLGVTPIAYSLEQAAEHDLVDEQHNAYSIILITDGGESCGGDICEVMKKLLKNKVYFRPYIVSLEDDPTLKVTYSCMGDYLQVTKDADIPKAVNTIVEAFRPIIKITPTEYKQMQTIAASAPSVLKVNVPTIKVPEPVDTVKAPPPPPAQKPVPVKEPEHKVKVNEEIPPRIPEKIGSVVPARLNSIAVGTPPSTRIYIPEIILTIPDIAPPIIKDPALKITRLTPARSKNFTIYTEYNSPRLNIAPLAIDMKLPPVVIDTPKPPVVAIKIPAPEKISRTTLARSKKLTTEIAEAALPGTVKPPSYPAIAYEAPAPPPAPKPIPPPPPPPVVIKIPAPEKISRPAIAHTRKLTIETPEAAKARTRKVPSYPAIAYEAPAPPPAPKPIPPPPPPPAPKPVVVERQKPEAEKISRLKPAKLVPSNVVFVIEERTYVKRRVPPLPQFKIDLPKTPVAKAGKLPADTQPAGKKMEYKIEAEDAKNTTVEVFFINAKGQLVTTTPQVALIDPVSKKLVKQFYRTVDPNGNPDPQTDIPVGTYNLTFPAKKNLVIANVHVEPNKRNKITVKVKNVSLSFAYFGDKDRPVKEFGARVIERNQAKGRVQDQLCTATLEYEPGNYHIRINTFPEDVRNVDLDLDDETVITILQPGFAKFTSDSKQVVTLYKEDGNKFSAFHQLDLNDPRSQHLQIQPGQYQVHYHKGPGGPSASEKVLPFIIKSNETTEIILK